MILSRLLATSSRAAAAFFARTTVSPPQKLITIPNNIKPKSVLILATPQNLSNLIESAISLHQNENLQVVVAGVERIVPNGASNGVSELWMDDLMSIENPVLLSDKDKPEPLRVSDGVHPVGAKVNWKLLDSSLNLNIQGIQLGINLANTAFYTNLLSTLFFFQPKGLGEVSSFSGQTLCGLLVVLPELLTDLKEVSVHDNWTPLASDGSEQLIVTNCTGNLLKGLNKLPASLFLEKNDKLMSIGSKDTKVHVKVSGKDGSKKRYEVIAGGGGWGAKADLLALSPEAQLNKGDRVEFFMVKPEDQGKVKTGLVSNQFLFECAPEAKTYEGSQPTNQTVENLFGCGSESGFVADGVNHKSPGESLSLAF